LCKIRDVTTQISEAKSARFLVSKYFTQSYVINSHPFERVKLFVFKRRFAIQNVRSYSKRLFHLVNLNRECVSTDHHGRLCRTKKKSSGMASISVFTTLHELLPYDASVCIRIQVTPWSRVLLQIYTEICSPGLCKFLAIHATSRQQPPPAAGLI
jgi:hypothetical protein